MRRVTESPAKGTGNNKDRYDAIVRYVRRAALCYDLYKYDLYKEKYETNGNHQR